jgi:DNA-directed RNA polymerase II subunit RPB2
MDENMDKIVWDIIDCHFRDNPQSLVRHHIDSYNNFFKEDIFKILRELNPITIVSKYDEITKEHKSKCTLYLGGKNGQLVYFEKPFNDSTARSLFPNEARLLNKTYEIAVYYDIEVDLHMTFDKNEQLINYERSNEEDENEEETQQFQNPKRDKTFLDSIKSQRGKEDIENDDDKSTLQKGNNLRKFTVNESIDMNKRFAESINQETNDQVYSFVLKKILLGRFPIMLQSDLCILSGLPKEMRFNMGECKNDLGGYFIIDGKEKTIVPKDILCNNVLYLNKEKNSIEINSVSDNFSKPKSTIRIDMCSNNSISITIPNVTKPIPLFVVFRALGLVSDKEIIQTCLLDIDKYEDILDVFIQSVYDAANIMTQSDAIKYIAEFTQEKTVSYVLMLLTDYLFPHIGETNYMQKAFFMGYMTKRLIESSNDDEKRICLIGNCFNELFCDYYKKQSNHIYLTFQNILYNDQTYYEHRLDLLIQNNYKDVFSKHQHLDDEFKKLLCEDLDRTSFNSTISHLRKVSNTNYQYGTVDFMNCEELSLLSHVTTNIPREYFIKWLTENMQIYLLDNCTHQMLSSLTKIFVNGYWVGGVENPIGIVDKIKFYRRNGLIPQFISVKFNIRQNTIIIFTDAGRLCRPLFYLDESMSYIHLMDELKKNNYNWQDLVSGFNKRNNGTNQKQMYKHFNKLNELYDVSLEQEADPTKFKRFREKKALLEYIDKSEEETTVIALKPITKLSKKYTHCEIHESLLLGIMTNLSSYPHHNRPNNILSSSSSSKSAASLYHTNYNMRMDNAVILNQGQKPLVKSRYSEYINNDENTCGENVIVAIAAYTGYNMEEAVLINEGSLKRGLFRTTAFNVYEAHEDNNTKFNTEKLNKRLDYSKLDKYGIIREGSEITDESVVLIGMKKINDCSLTAKKRQKGIVHKTFISERTAKVKIREEHVPVIGDTISSRCGLKSSIGLIVSETDMPFTREGLRPDIIINPNSIMSNLMVSQLIESIVGKACLYQGFHGDCTAFNSNGNQIGDFAQMLVECKMHSSGNNILYNGMTGEQMDSEIFMGPAYYMYLKQNVIEFNGQSARDKLTRQAVDGIEFGEMERDAMIAHGASDFLKETWNDDYFIAVCNKTGGIAIYNPDKNLFISPWVDGPLKFIDSLDGKDKNIEHITKFGRSFSVIRVPYAFKLFIQELQTMNVKMCIITEDNIDQFDNMKFSKTKIHIETDKYLDKYVEKEDNEDVVDEKEDVDDEEDEDEDEDDDDDDYFKLSPLKIQDDLIPPTIQYDTLPSIQRDDESRRDETISGDTNSNKPRSVSLTEVKTFNIGDNVNFKGDFNQSRVWNIQEFDKGFAVLKTIDTEGLENNMKVVHLNDISSIPEQIITPEAAAAAALKPNESPIKFSPVFNIVTGSDNTIDTSEDKKPETEESDIFSKPLIKKTNDVAEEKTKAVDKLFSGSTVVVKKLS